jgi:hypothetical protein
MRIDERKSPPLLNLAHGARRHAPTLQRRAQ